MVRFDDPKPGAELAGKKGLRRLWTCIAAHPRSTAIALLVSVALNIMFLLAR